MLCNLNHRQWVHQARPATFTAAVANALHAQAYYKTEEEYRPHALRVRIATEDLTQGLDAGKTTSESSIQQDRMKMLVNMQEKVEQKSAPRWRPDGDNGSYFQRRQQSFNSEQPRCYGCGDASHFCVTVIEVGKVLKVLSRRATK